MFVPPSVMLPYRNARLELRRWRAGLLMKIDLEEVRGFSLSSGLCVNELAAECIIFLERDMIPRFRLAYLELKPGGGVLVQTLKVASDV